MRISEIVSDQDKEQRNHYAEADQIDPSRVYAMAELGTQLTPRQINTLAKNAEYAYEYACNIIKGPFPEGEDAIATDAEYAYNYAIDIIKKPFPAGEDAISKNAWYAYLYAYDVLKSPWPKGEDAISKDAEYAYQYALYVLKLPEKQANRWSTNK